MRKINQAKNSISTVFSRIKHRDAFARHALGSGHTTVTVACCSGDMIHPEAPQPGALTLILDALVRLRAEVIHDSAQRLHACRHTSHARAWRSAANLAQYLALRQHDLRELQDQLALHGLSSLGRSEGHVLHTLDAVCKALGLMSGEPCTYPEDAITVTPAEARTLLESRTRELFGEHPGRRHTRIMVTLPSEAATDAQLCERLIAGGMDCARINCAHDDAAIWGRMIAHVRAAAVAAGRRCPIVMDLAGRKPRTGPVASGPGVVHIKLPRDDLGRPVGPAEVLLIAPHSTVSGAGVEPDIEPGARYRFELPATLATALRPRDRLGFEDTRGKQRELEIVERTAPGVWRARCWRSTWLSPDTRFRHLRPDVRGKLHPQTGHHALGGFTPASLRLRLHQGDTLLLTHAATPGKPTDAGKGWHVAHIGCVECGDLANVAVGDPVWIDDGHLGAEVIERRAEGLLLRITHARAGGVNLKADRGLNFPRSQLDLPSLTDKDLADLDFVARHADIVGLSFVEQSADLERLFEELHARQAGHLGVVAKIENACGVHALPELLFTALGRHPFGLMIARGDLAVELGGERLSEIQEEILWLAEAAHTPVVWATQVLESLAKQGAVSRPELSDAVLGQRADCVMLNKGAHILDALHTLNEVLRRTELRQWKNAPRLRALSIAR